MLITLQTGDSPTTRCSPKRGVSTRVMGHPSKNSEASFEISPEVRRGTRRQPHLCPPRAQGAPGRAPTALGTRHVHRHPPLSSCSRLLPSACPPLACRLEDRGRGKPWVSWGGGAGRTGPAACNELSVLDGALGHITAAACVHPVPRTRPAAGHLDAVPIAPGQVMYLVGGDLMPGDALAVHHGRGLLSAPGRGNQGCC